MTPFQPEQLSAANRAFARTFPGESGRRLPVHVVYGGGHLFKAETCVKLGEIARRVFVEYAPDGRALGDAMPIAETHLHETVHARVSEKLGREPIEDYRIDFEDGYGIRPDAEEDADADRAAAEMAKGLAGGTLPPFCGVRVKAFSEESKARGQRTLERFLTGLLQASGGKLPANFVVTLPKITVVEQVRALMHALETFPGVNVELMMETPQMLLRLPEFVAAALMDERPGRCVGVHFGPYDYTSQLGITAAQQSLLHPACDFARSMMQVMLAGSGLALSDGPTTLLPIAPHRGAALTEDQKRENHVVVHRAWKLHYENVRHQLHRGFYQGWDLHPAQLPARYAALYAFFLEGMNAAAERLKNFVTAAAQATRIGDVFDDAATGQGLLNYFLRAMSCGAIPETDIPALTGLTLKQLRSGSFGEILKTTAPPSSPA